MPFKALVDALDSLAFEGAVFFMLSADELL
jgi:hypothetical protein